MSLINLFFCSPSPSIISSKFLLNFLISQKQSIKNLWFFCLVNLPTDNKNFFFRNFSLLEFKSVIFFFSSIIGSRSKNILCSENIFFSLSFFSVS